MKKKMNAKLFVAIIIFTVTIDWMACDIFLPAEPEILAYFHTTAAVLNSTLSIYFIFSAISVLLGGPLSDEYGRKPVLLVGVALFTVFGFGCAVAPNVGFLIFCRGGAAFGSGIITAVTMAMVKDYLEAESFQKAMAVLQSIVVIGPVISPFLGSFLLILGGWRWVMAALGFLGAFVFCLCLALPETLAKERRVRGGVLPAMKGLVTVGRDREFSVLLLVISMFCIPFYAFIAVCSYIFISDYGLTYYQYSLIYGGICVISFTAPFLYLLLNKKLGAKTLLGICFVLLGITVAGCGSLAYWGPIFFFVVLIPYTYAEGISRPLGMVLLLNRHERTSGAASALTGFATSILGTVGTVVATLSWSNYLDGLFWIFLVCFLTALVLWLLLLKWKVKM